MKPWLYGNTTVRSPLRMRDGLIALKNSGLEGQLRGRKQEIALGEALASAGVVSLQGDETYSLGRKWRSALSKMGFLYPLLKGKSAHLQPDIGLSDTITPNGHRLMETESVAGWQECFLRALAAHYLPSPVDKRKDCPLFSPFRHTLSVMLELEREIGESTISVMEMAVIIQCTYSATRVEEIIKTILRYRQERNNSANKRKFDNEESDNAARQYGIKAATFKDYADANIRYLKATGLVQSKGRGVALLPEKRLLAEKISTDDTKPENDTGYFVTLCHGAKLPTDEYQDAKDVLEYLVAELQKKGGEYDLSGKSFDTPADIAVVRHEVEDLIAERNETMYAEQQALYVEEIAAYMGLLRKRKHKLTLSNGESIEIPASEAPAYFEWILWRAFLAINSLMNKPWEARRFKIDQDFFPVGTAPGNGPDMIFEFDDMVLVVEVTLTASSRQEAAEGEPVRRHVAKYAEQYAKTSKKVFGLFIAVSIDTNTANTFRLGEWYINGDQKIALHIVPFTLEDFEKMLIASRDNPGKMLPLFKSLLMECRMESNNDAPTWKKKISSLANKTADELSTNA